MKIYLHFYNDRNVREVKTNEATTIGSLIKEYAGKDATAPDYQEDLEVRIENQAEELSKDATLGQAKIKEHDHLHFSRCKKISTAINFAGKIFSYAFLPSNTIEVAFQKAVDHFKISKEDAKHLSLFLDESCDEPVPLNEHIGSMTGYPTCSVSLFLAKKKTFQG